MGIRLLLQFIPAICCKQGFERPAPFTQRGFDCGDVGDSKNGTSFNTKYIWMNGEVVGFIRSGSIYYVHNDGSGRGERVTASDKTIIWRSLDTPWNQSVTPGSSEYNLAAPGQYVDTESALVYNLNRYYEPALGRFLEPDPLGHTVAPQPYNYAAADPTSYIDFDGQVPLPLVTGAIGMGAGIVGNVAAQLSGCQDFNWADLAVAAGTGFVAGALAPFVPGGVYGAVAWGGAANLGQYAASSRVNNQTMTMSGALINVGTGMIGGAVGGAVVRASPYGYAGTAASREMVDASNNAASIKLNTGLSGLVRNGAGGVAGNYPITDNCGCK